MTVITTKIGEVVAVLPDFNGQCIINSGYRLTSVNDDKMFQVIEGDRMFFDPDGKA